jgi:hypothetical protein
MGEALKLAIMGWHALQLALGVGVKGVPEITPVEQTTPAPDTAPLSPSTPEPEESAPASAAPDPR